MLCGENPKAYIAEYRSDFCSKRCADDVADVAPIILSVDVTHGAFKSVSQQFGSQWKHPTPVPDIVRIWRVYSSKDHNDRFSRYKLSLERRTGLPGGNTRRRWHGTVRACRLGDRSDLTSFCGDDGCSLCSILKSSFEKAKAGQKTNFGRFGTGIYTSATSSKANDYIEQKSATPYRTMLLNEVIMGNTVKMTRDNPDLKEVRTHSSEFALLL